MYSDTLSFYVCMGFVCVFEIGLLIIYILVVCLSTKWRASLRPSSLLYTYYSSFQRCTGNPNSVLVSCTITIAIFRKINKISFRLSIYLYASQTASIIICYRRNMFLCMHIYSIASLLLFSFVVVVFFRLIVHVIWQRVSLLSKHLLLLLYL